MNPFHEIRIRIEGGNREVARAQEIIIRAMFQRYFAKDSYRSAIVLAVSQMLLVLIMLYRGFPTEITLITVIMFGLLRAVLKGIVLWASTPPPEPPRAPDGLPAKPGS